MGWWAYSLAGLSLNFAEKAMVMKRGLMGLAYCIVLGTFGGCEGDPRAPYDGASVSPPTNGTPSTTGTSPANVTPAVLPPMIFAQVGATPTTRRPVQLGGTGSASAGGREEKTADQGANAVRAALKPLQVMVGEWRGNTFRDNAVHEAHWLWDLKSDPAQPALVMEAEKNPFFKEARLTYLPNEAVYQLTMIDPTGSERKLDGRFAEEPQSVPSEDGKTLQRVFKLEFQQVAPKTGEQWQVLLNQQENNRFLLDLSKRRGTAPFRKFDTVSEQRQGTNFAFSDEGYGQKTCVISGGLGTTAVSYNGKTYWVCCSGCKAAFEENPVKWITEYEKKQSSN